MEPPLPQAAPPSDSSASSPRSRAGDAWDPNPNPVATGAGVGNYLGLPSKIRLMCSYGGHIVPRPHDKSLCYVGGDTRIVVVERHVTSLHALSTHLSKTLLHGRPFILKYQLPNEDLDSLITVSTDEDLDNMIDEHDRTVSNPALKPSRLRIFLFPLKPESSQSNIGAILDSSSEKSDDWFLNALNRGFSDTAQVNCLLGLQDGVAAIQANSADSGRDEKGAKQGQDVHSVPDSPMLETNSSFGSASSSPSIANLPSIRVRAEEGSCPKLGIEDQFSNMVVGAGSGGGLKQDDSFIVLSSLPPQPAVVAPTSGVPVSSGAGDYSSRVVSDDERSDRGIPLGFQKFGVAPPPTQQKSSGGLDLPSPDSVSSDSSLTNAIPRQRPVIYQDQVVQLASGANRVPSNTMEPFINILDPNTGVQLQQHIQDPGYLFQSQVDPRQQNPQHQQPTPQQQQQQQQQQLQQLPPFIQAGTHYISQHPAGPVPVTAYYSVYPPQQPHLQHPQLDQQYPLYYMPVNQAHAYNLSTQPPHPSSSDTAKTNPNLNPSVPARTQTPPNPTMVTQPTNYNLVRNVPGSKPEVAHGAVYRMTTSAASPLVQQQYAGYSPVHHPSQSIASASGGTPTFAYDFMSPAHSQQVYYTQHLGPTSAQYQTLAAAAVMPEASGQLQADAMKQQVRTLQGL
ncbi:hypothetical protein SAY86_019742 [Trapa natans]|uniref:PB1 domain-containing protein n=1 Tax=Trapa natans TaxID=22666 RepID=A0AAN7LY27_TRANT|nr:hypothetical protein SAY86_019742 [Trapa natans]